MDIILLKHYHELKLPQPLPFFNPYWDKHNKVLGPEKTIELYRAMGGKKYAPSGPCLYLMRELSYKLYIEGKDPYDAWCYFDTPLASAKGHFDKYGVLYPRF